jgi:hypothetical protein
MLLTSLLANDLAMVTFAAILTWLWAGVLSASAGPEESATQRVHSSLPTS